jgi:hypothetical protein
VTEPRSTSRGDETKCLSFAVCGAKVLRLRYLARNAPTESKAVQKEVSDGSVR